MDTKYTIEELIPQRAPMMMVDTFLGIEDGIAKAQLHITENNIFCDNGRFRESGIVEHMAQTAAARAGYVELSEGRKVVLGFIGSIDKLKIYQLPKIGDTLTTAIEVVTQVEDITMVRCTTTTEETTIAECSMKIFLKK